MLLHRSLGSLLITGMLATGLLAPSVTVHGESSDAEADLAVALTALEYQADATKGWIIEFTKTVKSRVQADQPFEEQTMHHLERRLGDKYRIEQKVLNDPKMRFHEERTFDGERMMQFMPLQKNGGISSSDIQPSAFGPAMYVDLQPFPGVLKEWEPLRGPEWVVRDGRRLLSLKLYSQKYLTENEILLDPKHSWQPAEFTSVSFDQRGGAKETSNRREARYVIQSYHQEGEICIPTKMVHSTERVQPNGARYRSTEGLVEVRSIKVNPDLSEETFRIEYPEGTQVFDKDRQVIFVAGQPGSEKPVRATAPPDPVAVPPNPAAGPWWSDYRPWIALSVVFIAGALWWRWREQP